MKTGRPLRHPRPRNRIKKYFEDEEENEDENN